MTVAGGTGTVAGTPLVTLDPRDFRTDAYRLRLRATDVAGRVGETETVVELNASTHDGYVRAETDFTVQIAGNSLAFTRRFDSLAADTAGAFGPGWRLDWRDIDFALDLPATGREALGAYPPLTLGTRAYVTVPGGDRVAFTFAADKHTDAGVTWYTARWVADAGTTWNLVAPETKLQRAGDRFYDFITAEPFNPATPGATPWQLVAVDGTAYEFDVARGVTAIVHADGTRLHVSDSGVIAQDGEAIVFTLDQGGRIADVVTNDGRNFHYEYDAAGRLVAVRDLEAAQSRRFAYDASDRLVLATGPEGGGTIRYGANGAVVDAIDGDLGPALRYLAGSTAGNLAAGGADVYTFAVRESEIRAAAGGAVLLGVVVDALDGDLAPALPAIAGMAPVSSRVDGHRAFALYRIDAAGLNVLSIAGSGTGRYSLSLFVAGDVDRNGRVDGLDAALLAAARGTQAGQAGFLPAGDFDSNGRIDAADTQLLFADLGYAPNQAPLVNTAVPVLTHEDLQVTVPMVRFVADPEGDPLFFKVLGTTRATARLSGDGRSILVQPEAGFTGRATVSFRADDGYGATEGTVQIDVSDAPLLHIAFVQRRPEIDVGGHFQPVVIGDFADQQGVELPLPYVTLTSLDPGVASVSDRGELTGLTQGVGTLRANRGDVQAATAFVVGQPNRFDQIQLFTGLDVYPDAITLVPVVGHKQLQVRVGDADATPLVATDAQYFASNPGIVTVGADGTLTAVGAGDADVTVIYRGVEFVVPVTVRAPVANQAVLGEDGGAIAAADGTVFAIAPDSLEGERLVKVGTVAQSDLPMAVPEDFNFLGAWKLEYDGDSLTTPAQLAIPVPESVPVGKQLYLFRAGDLPNERGEMTPVWWQDEVAVVGADHVARTSSPPWPGVRPAGVWMLGDPQPGVSLVRGILTVNFPIGAIPIIAGPGIGGIATVVPMMAVSINVSQLKIVAIPQVGLPVVTTVGVKLDPGVVTNAHIELTQPPQVAPDSPSVLGGRFEFREISGRTVPVLVLTGTDFRVSPGTSAGSRTIVQFVQQGKTIDAVALGAPTAISADLDEIAVEVPQSVIAGIADIRVVRLDRVVALGDCSGTFTTVEKAFASNALRLPVEGNYVLSALRIANEVAVLTQGNPFAANPPAELDLVARIPVAPLPRATSVTKDHTRAYVTYSGDATVAAGVTVIDLVSLQEVDAQPGNAPSLGAADPLDRITLPPGARPGQIVLDAANRYAYVADEGRGAVYVIDIDPKSPDFHKSSAVRTIVLPEAETLQGLRGIAIGEDGKRLYVAAPNRVSYSREFRAFSSVFVINVDSADRPENPAENPKKYWEQIAEISMDEPGKTLPGQETFALSNTGDPKRIAFTNRYNDTSGFGLIDITNDAVDGFAANVHSIGLALGASGDTFDVNNGVSLAFLPADAFKEVIGPHPA